MKKILTLMALITLATITLTLSSCRGSVVDVTVVVKNATDYEIKRVIFNIAQSFGSYSPMHDIITTENDPLKPGDEREVFTWLYDSDFGNSGSALIDITDGDDSATLDTAQGGIVLERGINRFVITHNGENFVIKALDGTDANISAAENIESDTSPDPGNEFTLTIFADFPGETWEKETNPLPIENEPASPSLIVFYLADELSEWTGFDFTLNDVSFGENSVTVDWSKDSTLIAGLDDRNQKEDFHFLDSVSLNWFMMDSLAVTLKNNLDVTTVYYCSDGDSVTFSNPEDMAEQGLPELPADQPYEGSTFFTNNAGRGDLIDSDSGDTVIPN